MVMILVRAGANAAAQNIVRGSGEPAVASEGGDGGRIVIARSPSRIDARRLRRTGLRLSLACTCPTQRGY